MASKANFFKDTWDICGKDIVEAVQDFFASGRLLKVNTTNIRLVPRKPAPNTVKDFHPIYCSNVLYKATSKVLRNRWRVILASLVDHDQAAFMRVETFCKMSSYVKT